MNYFVHKRHFHHYVPKEWFKGLLLAALSTRVACAMQPEEMNHPVVSGHLRFSDESEVTQYRAIFSDLAVRIKPAHTAQNDPSEPTESQHIPNLKACASLLSQSQLEAPVEQPRGHMPTETQTSP